MILLCESVKNILMAKVSPARPPCKTFHGHSESKLHMIVEVNYMYTTIVNIRTSIRVNVLHGGRAGDTLAIKIFFTLSHNKIIAEKV